MLTPAAPLPRCGAWATCAPVLHTEAHARAGPCGRVCPDPDKELVAESFLKDASLVITYYAKLTARPPDALRRLAALVAPFFALKLQR